MSNFQVAGRDFTDATISFDEAIGRVCNERQERQDFQIPIREFSLSLDFNGEKIVGTIDGRDYVPTAHCLKQMATWYGVSHAVLKQYMNPVLLPNGKVRYNRDSTDMELLVALFKNGCRDGRINPDKEFQFRTYSDGTLRAMVSDRYARIDNVWYLNMLREIVGDSPRFVHWRGDADTLRGNLVLPDSIRQEVDSDYGGMLSISNCEIGKRRLSIMPSVFRSVCSNGVVFGQQTFDKLSQVHRGDIDLHALRLRIHDNVNSQLPILNSGIDNLLNTQQIPNTTRVDKLIAQVAQDYKMSTGQKGQVVDVLDSFVNHEKRFNNLFGVVNAITRAAQMQTPDEHVRFEEIGGQLLSMDQDKWLRFNNRAAGMSDKQYNKTFGIVAV